MLRADSGESALDAPDKLKLQADMFFLNCDRKVVVVYRGDSSRKCMFACPTKGQPPKGRQMMYAPGARARKVAFEDTGSEGDKLEERGAHTTVVGRDGRVRDG